MARFEVLSRRLPGETSEKHENLTQMVGLVRI
jgi:hypothetical protein